MVQTHIFDLHGWDNGEQVTSVNQPGSGITRERTTTMTETMALHPADSLYAALTAAELDGPLPRTGRDPAKSFMRSEVA
jgi:hypothetical protein